MACSNTCVSSCGACASINQKSPRTNNSDATLLRKVPA
jgi:hypothetical protein